jgi:hypothetical protein
MNIRIRFLFFLLLGLSFPGYCQEEDEIPEIITNWEDAPLYLSAGPTLSRYQNTQSPLNFPFTLKGEGGFLFQYSLNQQFPFWSGLEFQMRGYSISNFKSGNLPDGRYYEDKISGDGKMNYLVFPMLFSIPASMPEKKLHFLAGASIGLRVYSRIKFKAVRSIPSDTLEIPVEYDDVGNDAIDLMDFNLAGGVGRRNAFLDPFTVQVQDLDRVSGTFARTLEVGRTGHRPPEVLKERRHEKERRGLRPLVAFNR